ncbi:16S rRNA methyltransferase [Gracilaria domingensis]|nr:16S rRNA methyltransferase [Gracilaria domingensis]
MASTQKCSLIHEPILFGAYAMDSSRDPISYPTGKAKAETRVFVDSFFREKEIVRLPHEECKHLRARRFRNGDKLVLLNSLGQTAAAIYQNEAAIVIELLRSELPSKSLSLIIAIPKIPSRADWLVEKLTELGADSIHFMQTKRTIATAPSPNKLQRWNRLAISASKQSLRDSTPTVSVVDFEVAVEATSQYPIALLLCPKGKPLLTGSFMADVEREQRVLLLAGPEGGFEEEEIEELLNAGATRVSLGRNRLRTETAAMTSAAVISQLLYRSFG